MIQPPRQELVVVDEDAVSLTVWTDVPLDELMKIDGVYDVYGMEPGPKVIMCDPRWNAARIEAAIRDMAAELEGTDV